MQRLNIPLSRHTKTTRRNRQVVWLMAFALLVGGFLAFRFGTWWMSRGTILSLAPSDTVLAIELHLNEKTGPFLSDWLAGVPLISERSLELSDLSPYTHGDLAIFVTSDGERSVAIRSSKERFPENLLIQYGVVVQEQGGFLLLSSHLAPIAGTQPLVHRPFLPSLGEAWLGRVVLPDSELTGNLFLSDREMTLEVAHSKRGDLSTRTVENASVSLMGLTWSDQVSSLDGLKRLVSESLFLQAKTPMHVVIRPKESGLETLIAINDAKIDSDLVVEELEKIGAFARPSLVTQTLPDGTSLQEILVQSEFVSVEEISTSLGLAYRVPTEGGDSILAALHEGSAVFSNSQDLLETYAESSNIASADCTELTNGLNPTFLLSQTQLDQMSPSLAVFSRVMNEFSSLLIEAKKYSTKIHLCRL